MKQNMNETKFEQFIGIFPNAINDELCSEYVKWFDAISEQGFTTSPIAQQDMTGTSRKDEYVYVPSGLTDESFPDGLIAPLWKQLHECYNKYYVEYDIDQPMSCEGFKVHRVQLSEGYHVWHHEHMYSSPYRILVWHLTIESPKLGGETEFLYQSMRVEPKVGQLLIWPAGFTHKHRGAPPLEGQKTYITGWFDVVRQ
jgi:hypothetical protein